MSVKHSSIIIYTHIKKKQAESKNRPLHKVCKATARLAIAIKRLLMRKLLVVLWIVMTAALILSVLLASNAAI